LLLLIVIFQLLTPLSFNGIPLLRRAAQMSLADVCWFKHFSNKNVPADIKGWSYRCTLLPVDRISMVHLTLQTVIYLLVHKAKI